MRLNQGDKEVGGGGVGGGEVGELEGEMTSLASIGFWTIPHLVLGVDLSTCRRV